MRVYHTSQEYHCNVLLLCDYTRSVSLVWLPVCKKYSPLGIINWTQYIFTAFICRFICIIKDHITVFDKG